MRDELDLLAADLARYRAVAAPAGVRARVRAQIMAAPVAWPAPRASLWSRALRPLLALSLVLAVILAGGGVAAAGSLPGDPAFALKRAAEEAQVALTFDDAGRLDVLATQLDRRLDELERVAAQRPVDLMIAIAEYEAALRRVDLQRAVVAATDPASAALARASSAADDHIARLEDLAQRLPAAAQPGIERAIGAQQRVRGDQPPAGSPLPSESESPGRPGIVPSASPRPEPTRPPAPTGRGDRTAVPTRR